MAIALLGLAIEAPGEKECFCPCGKLRSLSTLDRDRQVPSGQWTDPGFGFCVILCSALRKRSATKVKRSPWFYKRGLRKWGLWTLWSPQKKKKTRLSR